MKKIVVVFILLISFYLSAQQKLKLSILNFEDNSEKIEADVLSVATDSLRMYLENFGRYSVIPKDRQDEAASQIEGCKDKICRIKLGQTLGADLVAYPYIILTNEQYVVAVDIFDIAKKNMPISVRENWDGEQASLDSTNESIVRKIRAKQTNLDALSQNFITAIEKEDDSAECEQARSEKERTKKRAWEKYLKEYPNGKCVEEARAYLADFDRVKDKETCEQARSAKERTKKRAWEKYLKEYPNGQCAEEARVYLPDFETVKDKETCEKARMVKERTKKRTWERYLKEYPNGQCAEEARAYLADYDRLKDKETCEKTRSEKERTKKRAWERYLKEYPNGQCAEEARDFINNH